MSAPENYVTYVDLLGIGDASLEDGKVYHEQLRRFRIALCDAVDRHMEEGDKIFAFSDCAFASSQNLERIGSFLMRLQYSLWEHNIFLKGAISIGTPDHVDFADMPKQSKKLVKERKRKLQGYWFSKEFVYPALMEKNLKGIAIQVDSRIKDDQWIKDNVVTSSYFSSDSSKRPTVIRDLLIREEHLPALEELLKTYMLISHGSRRVSRYYVPLIVTWIKSYNYSKIKFESPTVWHNAPLPLRQLILNSKIASEVTSLVGGDVIYYSLLAKVANDCVAEKVTEKVFEFISGNKKLRAAVEIIPDEICPRNIRQRMIESRIQFLFNSST